MFEAMYKEIAILLFDHAPAESVRVAYSANFEVDDVIQNIQYDYWLNDETKKWFMIKGDDDDIIDDHFRHIQTEMEAQTGDRWNTVTFAVDRSGKFDVDFGYD